MKQAILAGALALCTPAMAQDAGQGENLALLGDQVEQAMLVDDGGRLPLADGFRYTENGQRLDITDGMWGTLSALVGQDARRFPAAAQLTYRFELTDGDELIRLVETDENGVKGLTAMRMKAASGKIAELEVIPVREEFGGARGGTVTLLQPAMLVTMDGERLSAPDPLFGQALARPIAHDALVSKAEAYIAALVSNDASHVALAGDCRRSDNGQPTTGVADAPALDPAAPAYRPFALGCRDQVNSGFFTNIQRMRGLRSWADPARGVVVSFVQLDVPGTALRFTAPGAGQIAYPGPTDPGSADDTSVAQQFNGGIRPNLISPVTMNAVFLMKIDQAGIQRIEAFYRGAPYGFRSGW